MKQPGTFCCDDGFCIESKLRCDSNNHCEDNSDENRCEIVQVPKTYNTEIPPSRKETIGENVSFYPIEIDTFVEVRNILNINEQASMISLQFAILLRWVDYRLSYNFLQEDADENSLTEIENIIWTPSLTFSIKSDPTKSLEVDRQIRIEKKGHAFMDGGLEHIQANESYPGSENPITLDVRKQGDFFCEFNNIVSYPFDTEECSVSFYISGSKNNLTKLKPVLPIGNVGPSSVGQYSVQGWTIVEDRGGLKFTVRLGRDLYRIFMITYLPTIVMNLINQATNYSKNNYDLVMTVNITCMMVLASIYVSVSNSLPLTAGMKIIDYWLLFNLVYPAMVIAINIFLQVRDHFQMLLIQ